jgi:hypothetical protein
MSPPSSRRAPLAALGPAIAALGFFVFFVNQLARAESYKSFPKYPGQHEHHHRDYLDPFCSGWYPGYAGAYDSNYYYTPTPDQVTAAQKQVQTYVAAVHKGRHPARHRYIAVRTLNPTKVQLAEYEKKLADAKSAAASGESQLSNRWVAPDKLRCVMLFDTQSKQFVGNGCYVIAGTPPSGTVAKFDTYSAEFVGGSSL